MVDALLEHQQQVAHDALAQEHAQRDHLVVHLSGAHAYGFASPDSDLDLKAIHVAPTATLLGLRDPERVANRLEVIDHVEVDYTSNEVGVALRGLLKGDGNMLERVLSQTALFRSDDLPPLAELAVQNLSKRYYAHYRGFARSQRNAAESSEATTAKKVLYVLRTALTGAHLLEAGTCEPDLTALAEDYGFSQETTELIDIKRSGEVELLPESITSTITPLFDRAFHRLDRGLERSALPEEPAAEEALEGWLVELRRSRLEP